MHQLIPSSDTDSQTSWNLNGPGAHIAIANQDWQSLMLTPKISIGSFQ